VSSALVAGVRASAAPAALRFARALARPERAQRRSLAGILSLVDGSAQAARLTGLGRVRTPGEYQRAVPLSSAEDYAPAIARQLGGARAELTREPVLRFEVTGGSSGPSKHVPYTGSFLAELNRALGPWLADLFTRHPRARRGPGYWSVSPVGAGPRRSAGGVPIGASDDAAYFPAFLRPALRRLFAVPGAVARLPDVDSARYVTLRLLLESRDLAFASAWNPSFLTLLFEALDTWAERLADDLARGRCSIPGHGDNPPLLRGVRFRALPSRAAELRSLARGGLVPVQALWPALALVSVWTDAQASRAVPALRSRLGSVPVQGKGLLATEAVVSIPLEDAPAPVLAVRSPFLEFLDADGGVASATPRLAHELETGRTYEVVLSTAAGLLRYRIGDLVRVEGRLAETPCVRFVGRADQVSDLVGEKLHVARVSDGLAAVPALAAAGGAVRFVMLAPEWGRPPAYHLFVEGELRDEELDDAAAALDRRLASSYHYGYARSLGQLGPVRAVRVRDGARRYEARLAALGQRTGVIKPADLHTLPGWLEHFVAERA
jgi:hypothetical protein